MKYILLVFASLFIIAGCGKSQEELEKERIQKEAAELKRRIDSTSQYIERERKSLDSNVKKIDSLSTEINKIQKQIEPKKLGTDAIKKTDELIPTEKIEKEKKDKK